jgi:hypothetical protein
MRQTKSHKILVHDLVSGLNRSSSYSAENLPDSQAFMLLVIGDIENIDALRPDRHSCDVP